MKKGWRFQVAFAAAGLLLAAGCGGSSSKGIGWECDASDECDTGLSCLRQSEFDFDTGACVPGSKYCSIPCDSDAACTDALGAGHICVGGAEDALPCPPGLCFEGSTTR